MKVQKRQHEDAEILACFFVSRFGLHFLNDLCDRSGSEPENGLRFLEPLLAHGPLEERTSITAGQSSRKPGLVARLIFLQEAGANAELSELGADRYLAREGRDISPF